MARRRTQKKGGYRGSLGGAPMHGAFTTAAEQELKQMGGAHSNATKKAIQKALQKQKIVANAAAASRKAAKNAANAAKSASNAAKKAEHNAQQAIRAANEQKAQNRKMINDLVKIYENKHNPKLKPSAHSFEPVDHHNNSHHRKMVNDLVGI